MKLYQSVLALYELSGSPVMSSNLCNDLNPIVAPSDVDIGPHVDPRMIGDMDVSRLGEEPMTRGRGAHCGDSVYGGKKERFVVKDWWTDKGGLGKGWFRLQFEVECKCGRWEGRG
ncbi:hypothetical protein GOBAR_AA00760 [Gossypium barbadense]|uniref:Uncharacterized protein n=1 Tax=Gossypium barbadense TaxID=3634 RepID=A0A2P5YWB5_GOSBA|nr:hypothetical protein GOBAR_AA00760 [Gossypium barbadense]